ncbi:MAG: hypothetical protein EOP50_09455 [Sphingobacteriales bacterium]|nr:MAG: hypothetical protein EOP50_09455 [Sphingobacteriales bacterium]
MDNQCRAPKLGDPEFQQTLTLAEAYQLLYKFVEQYNARGESSTLDLLTDLSLDFWADGSSTDPAQLDDFLAVAEEVLKRRGHVA